MLHVVLTLGLASLPLLLAVFLFGRVNRVVRIPTRSAAWVFVMGALGGAVALLSERMIFDWADLSLTSAEVGTQRALLTTFLLAAPLEEAVKVLAVWPIYLRGQLRHAWTGLGFALFAALGFSTAEAAVELPAAAEPWGLALKLPLLLAGHLLCAGAWGSALSERGLGRGAWFSWTWVLAVLLSGTNQRVVHGASLAQAGYALPVVLVALLAGSLWMRRAALDRGQGPESLPPVRSLTAARGDPVRSARPGRGPALDLVRRAFQRSRRKLLLHWIALGALVMVGLVISLVGLAVYLGHRLGVDFARADEAGLESTPPILLLSLAVLAAFPLGGFLLARASGTDSVLEPALASALALALLAALLSMTAPLVFVFALGVSPLAFLLACGGAWFGLERD